MVVGLPDPEGPGSDPPPAIFRHLHSVEYEWSSARGHVEGRDPLGLLDLDLWKDVNRGHDWRDALARTRDEEAAEMAELRRAARTGRPLGGDGFVKRLEAALGRKLDGKRTGRPKKEQAAAAGK